MPTMREVEMRQKQINLAMNRKMGDNEINHMLKEKQKFMLNPTNYAMYKSKLKKDIDNAMAAGDDALVDELSNKLSEIEERAEQGIRMEMERMKKEGQVSDPFTRRKTQPVLPTHVIKKTEASAAASNNGVSDSNGGDH